MEDTFVGRFYHNRVVQRNGKNVMVFDLNLKKKAQFIGEMKWKGNKRKIEGEIKWGGCKLEGRKYYILKS